MNTQAPSPRRRNAAQDARRRVTMTDVARAAGCSQATVSLVLNGVTGIKLSQALKDKVIAVATELGYVLPPAKSRPGAAAATGTIAFVVDQMATSPEAIVAIEGARQASWDDGNVVVAAQTLSDTQMEQRTLKALTGRGTIGVIYMAIFTRQLSVPALLYDLDIPVVLLNCTSEDGAFPRWCRQRSRAARRLPGTSSNMATGVSPPSPASHGWTRRATGSRDISGR